MGNREWRTKQNKTKQLILPPVTNETLIEGTGKLLAKYWRNVDAMRVFTFCLPGQAIKEIRKPTE